MKTCGLAKAVATGMIAVALVVLGSLAARAAYFSESFDTYTPGLGVAAQSSGVWTQWPGCADALVQTGGNPGNAMNFTDNSGAVDLYAIPGDLYNGQSSFRFSCDFYHAPGAGDGLPQLLLENTQYGSNFAIFFGYYNGNELRVRCGSDFDTLLTTFTPSQWHHLTVDVRKIVPAPWSVSYGIYLDSLLLSTVYGNDVTLNTIEFGEMSSDGNPATFVLVDNVNTTFIPEPSIAAMLGMGLAGILIRRRSGAGRSSAPVAPGKSA